MFIIAALIYSCSGNAGVSAGGYTSDSTGIAVTIHGFYKWYNSFLPDNKRNINFVDSSNGHPALNENLLQQYYTNLKAGGFISPSFIDSDKVLIKACAVTWQQQALDEPPACMDEDRFFCAQDWDIPFWTSAPVIIQKTDGNKATVLLSGNEAGSHREQKIDMEKVDNKWLIAKIYCGIKP